jgi:hypothetical protein
MTVNPNALGEILQQLPDAQLTTVHLPGVQLVIDDPTVPIEHLSGTSGVTDVFVFDGSAASDNLTSIDNFDASEDYILFRNMDGRDVFVSTWAVVNQPIFGQALTVPSDSVHGTIGILATTQTADSSVIEHYVLAFDGTLFV